MSTFDQGEVSVDVVQDMRNLAGKGVDVPEIADWLARRLDLNANSNFLAGLVYFRSAFFLTLREALPLREWLGGRDRSEIDSILIPAMQRTRNRWEAKETATA